MINDWKKYLDEMNSGTDSALARLISHVENRKPGWNRILQAIFSKTGKARVIGITGFGGVGKSTLTGQLAITLAQRGKTVGIIAIDPSSPFTGGALLGDRIRMQVTSYANSVFIRSMASRNFPGGICRAARDTIRLMDAFGKDYVLVETVGIGQNQVDITKITELVMLVCAPGQGDSIQTLKSGIFEAADLFVVNKADLPGANLAANEIHSMLSLDSRLADSKPPILMASADKGEGISVIAEKLHDLLVATGKRDKKHEALIRQELVELLQWRLTDHFTKNCLPVGEFEQAVERAVSRYQDTYTIVDDLMSKFFPNTFF